MNNTFELIKNTNSRLLKERELKNASDFDKTVFKITYDFDTTYGLKFKGPFSDIKEPEDKDGFFLITFLLSTRRVTGNAARKMVEDFAAEHGDLIKLVCNKDLDIGISVSTINKVFPGLVPEFNVQLAKEEPLQKLVWPLVAQLKYDGVRVVTLKDNNGNVTFRTRNGKTFECPQLERQMELIPNGTMLDGELVMASGKTEDRTKISGLVNSAIKGTPLDGSKVTYYLFDGMTYDDFVHGKCDKNYAFRYKGLEVLCHIFSTNYCNIELALTSTIESKDQADKHFDFVLAKGYEGLILKSWQHKYSFKRSKDWVKMKAINDVTFTCTMVQEGEGKYEGQVGALVCNGFIASEFYTVKVGSGLTDADRALPWETYIGKKIDIKYNQVIKDSKTGQWSLFLPRFITIRGDL